jgi:uncharacterized Zn-binding protein involved in type VI secretion
MKIIGWIRYGDKTACGGTVIEGDQTCIGRGRAYAFQGARVACRKNCVIIEGFSCSTLSNGRSRVIHGMVTSGGCPCYSTLNDIDGVGNESGEAMPETFKPGQDGEWIPVYAPLKHEDCEYDQHVILVDQEGKPLEGVPYRAFDAQGAIIEGITEADGKTKIVAGQHGDVLDCEIIREAE